MSDRISVADGFKKDVEADLARAKGLSVPEKLAPVLGELADFASTEDAIHNHGAVEGNPTMKKLTGSLPLFLLAKLAVGVGASYAGDQLVKAGHKGWGRGLVWGMAIKGFGAAALNEYTVRKGN